MQVSVENTSALERRMTIGVPAERIEAEVNKRLQQTAQKAKIPGFRPGKVPMSVIRQRYEADARQEALGNVVQSSFYEAVVEQKLNPAGAPSIEPKVFEKGKDLEYVATFEVFPEFEVTGLDTIAIERLSAEVADADLDKMLDVLRKQNTRFEVTDRAAQNDDQLNIDFVGKVDGEVFAGGSATGLDTALGAAVSASARTAFGSAGSTFRCTAGGFGSATCRACGPVNRKKLRQPVTSSRAAASGASRTSHEARFVRPLVSRARCNSACASMRFRSPRTSFFLSMEFSARPSQSRAARICCRKVFLFFAMPLPPLNKHTHKIPCVSYFLADNIPANL